MIKTEAVSYKAQFKSDLKEFTKTLTNYVSTESGEWTVKGFIDIYKNIYTVSSDTKIVSKILEIHIFPQILLFAEKIGYKIVLAEEQNWYPDLSFVKNDDEKVKFAVDLKTTYRDLAYPGHVNGFTLGSHGKYFIDRKSTKNIQYPYSEYLGHFCLGIIYSRADIGQTEETRIHQVEEIKEDYETPRQTFRHLQVTTVKNLKSITSVIKDFDFFVAEKWEIASDSQGSKNTANIGSITNIEDLKNGKGIFANLGEKWFDEYWINYGSATLVRNGETIPIRNLKTFLEFKGRTDLLQNIVVKNTKKKNSK